MNDVAELKQYVQAHARIQRLPRARYTALLARVGSDTDGAPGSWAVEWSRSADELARTGQQLAACRHYNMARFPFVDGPQRAAAHRACVAAFDRWRGERGIEPLAVPVDGGTVRCQAAGLSTVDKRPLVLMMGGIVSVKEQWAPLLPMLRRLGFAALVTEMPGVGENTTRYGPASWRMIPALLDAVADRADVSRTYAIGLSFSGHLALRCAATDPRLRAVITAGAPVRRFFSDADRASALPRITRDTLAHLLAVPAARVPETMRDWGLTDDELAALDIPVHCLVSRRDEIIPYADAELLRQQVSHLSTMENDDVHGSPAHAAESRLWAVLSLLRASGASPARTAPLAAALRLLRLRGRFSGRQGDR